MSGARLAPGSGEANIATGVPLLDHLLVELARAGGFELALEIEPDEPDAEVDAAGAALGRALVAAPPPAGATATATMVPPTRRSPRVVARGVGQPLVVSNVDLTRRAAGSGPTSPRASSARSRTPPG